MKKKVLVTLIVIALALVSVSAKDLGIKVGGELGWGIDIGKMQAKFSDTGANKQTYKAVNNGFGINVTGEYDIDKNWAVKGSFGMMFAGKPSVSSKYEDRAEYTEKAPKSSGLYIDFIADAKYTYALNKEISVAGLAGIEMLYGHFLKSGEVLGHSLGTGSDDDVIAEYTKNFGFGLNLGVEGSYKITDEISAKVGFTGAWLFVNTAKFINDMKDSNLKLSVSHFYLRPYLGATYSF